MGFDNRQDCVKCQRRIDGVDLKVKRIVTNDEGKWEMFCTQCIAGNTVGVPDVWYGYGSGEHTEENICDPKSGQPIPFSSKASKLAAMRQAGVHEVGDRVHGTLSNFTNKH